QQTQQWFKIAGDELVPRDGYYDLRLTDEYWETYYIDYYSLLVVDHPQESHIYVDERVADPPAPLKLYVTGEPRSFASAKDDTGRDVSSAIQKVDGNYLNTFGVGQYQGLTRDHWVDLELPEDAPHTGPLYLIVPDRRRFSAPVGRHDHHGAKPGQRPRTRGFAHRSSGPGRTLGHRAKSPRYSGRPPEDRRVRFGGNFSDRRATQTAFAHQYGSVLGQAGVGYRSPE
ncbi:MAG: hypothetical protein ABSH50_26275, partial [Bryobacteraceae bacterium]